MKNILVIKTSLRQGSNSSILADSFIEGAKAKGHTVNEVSLMDINLQFCKGCLACQKTGKCVIDDDARKVVDLAMLADVIVFATPIYYYEMAGQMKTMIDRLNPMYSLDYKFKSVYLITTAAEDDKSAMDQTVSGVEGFVSCFNGVKLNGMIYGVNVNNPNEASSNQQLLKDSYNMGYEI